MFPPSERYKNRKGQILVVMYDSEAYTDNTVSFKNQETGTVTKLSYSEAEQLVERREIVWYAGPPPGSAGGGPVSGP